MMEVTNVALNNVDASHVAKHFLANLRCVDRSAFE